MMIHNIDNNRGFTLFEILIAIVVLSIGLLGVAQMTLIVVNRNAFGKQQTTATTLALDRIEELKRVGYDNVNAMAGTEDYGAIPNHEYFKRITTVTNGTPAAAMKTITVTVFWNGDNQSVAFQTIQGE